MKTNLITFTAVLALATLLFSGSANAAEPVTTGQVTFNLVLNPIQSIVINTKVSAIEYTSFSDYKNGVSEEFTGQIDVFSTQAFNLSAKANDFIGTNKPELNTINIMAETSAGHITNSTGIFLSGTDQTIYTSDNATEEAGIKFDIHYTGAGENTYAKKEYFTQASNVASKTTYTTTVTYSIVAL